MPVSVIQNASFGNSGIVTANGIKFPATKVPSADANVLDDYEEGTWTPIIISTNGSLTSYTVQTATYTKIGRAVTVNMQFFIANNGTGAGRLQTSSLPFAASTQFSGAGREGNAVGFMVMTTCNSTDMLMWRTDNSYPGGTNYSINVTCTYFI